MKIIILTDRNIEYLSDEIANRSNKLIEEGHTVVSITNTATSVNTRTHYTAVIYYIVKK